MEMIAHGAEKIINSTETSVILFSSLLAFWCTFLLTEWLYRFTIDDDIDKIIQHGEERTAELNSKYEGFNFDDLNNFKSDSMLQWEGEEGAKNVRSVLRFSGQNIYDSASFVASELEFRPLVIVVEARTQA